LGHEYVLELLNLQFKYCFSFLDFARANFPSRPSSGLEGDGRYIYGSVKQILFQVRVAFLGHFTVSSSSLVMHLRCRVSGQRLLPSMPSSRAIRFELRAVLFSHLLASDSSGSIWTEDGRQPAV
jgi:hypothetical protein